MKYNSDLHLSVINNLKELARKESIDISTLKDSELWNIFEIYHGCDVSDETELYAKYGDDAAYIVGFNLSLGHYAETFPMIYQLQFVSCPSKFWAESSIASVEKQLFTSKEQAKEISDYWYEEFKWEFYIIERNGI